MLLQKERIISNFIVALESVAANKIRSLLTALGIIFGVTAVITMLAIGKGAEKEIMDQMELVGVNNISITSFSKQEEGKTNSESGQGNDAEKKQEISPGLTIADAKNIYKTIPGIFLVSPEIIIDTKVIRNGVWRTAQLIGIENSFFEIYDFNLAKGDIFTQEQISKGLPVCIIGSEIKSRFIDEENPIGIRIKCNDQWLTIVGILENKSISKEAQEHKDLGIRNYNMDIYIPLQTMLIRYENRSLVTQDLVREESQNGNKEKTKTSKNYHQLDKITVKIKPGYDLSSISDIISRILKRRHQEIVDYTIVVPELLLQQQQKAKRVFKVVLAFIAGISLLVGGIGIMNILLASVLERIREIGLRIALGAKQKDIVQQFLFEAAIIGVSGGLIGVLLGIIFSILTQYITGITTIVTLFSILLAFFVAVSIGLIFGIAPAKKAAKQDPISSLRHE